MNKKRLFIFKQALALFMVLCSVWGWGQVVVVSDGLNNSSSLFDLNNGSYYTGNSASGDRPATSPFAIEGSHSRGISNGTATLTSNNINTTNHTNLELSFRLASFSIGSTGNGADAGDIVNVEISPNGGNNWYSTLRVLGNSNAYWAYSTGSATAETTYDGNASPVDFAPAAGGNRTTDGYSTVKINGLPSVADLRVRITLLNNATNERWLVDDVKLVGVVPSCTPPEYLFDQDVVAKTTTDPAFTNEFISDNTSPTVFASTNSAVATVDQSTGLVTIAGVGSATIEVTQVADGTHCAVSASYTLNVTSAAPSLAISGTANHGPVCIGTPASVQTYTVTNTGNSAAAGLSVTFDNPQFVVSNISSTTVDGVNGTVTFDVTFTPAAAGAQNAKLTVTSTTSGSNTATYQITGTGNPTVAPAVAVGNADVTNDAATLHGNVTSLGSCLASPIVNRGFVYTVFSSPEINGGTYVNEGTSATGAFSVNITGLVPAKIYYYKAFVVDAAGQYYYSPTEGTFTTSLATPVATAATNVTPVGFTANWNAVNGAESYVLEVYEETGSPMTDLIISEYVEGSSSNKYIEIYNGTGAEVNLADYKLQLYANGDTSPTNDAQLSGTLANGAVKVYKNNSSSLTLPSGVSAESNTALNFNGDDALALFKVSTLSFVDIFGRIGNDPGIAWTGSDGYSTLDKTLRRKSSIKRGITTSPSGTGAGAFISLTTEWDLFNIDIVSGLGTHTANTVTVTPLITQNVGNVFSFDLTGLNPGSNYTYTVKAVSGAVTSAASNIIAVSTGTIWNGTAWTNGNPIADLPAIIDGNYSEATGFTSKSLTVNTGKILTVNSFVKTGDVTNHGTITVANNANFVQTGTFTAVAGSSFKVRKDTKPVKRLAYINWSSPMAVSTQTLKDFSFGKKADGSNQSATGTVDNRFFTYNNNTFVSIVPTTTFEAGAGYQIRTPNDFTTTPQVFHGQFEGTVPNSGPLSYDHNGIIMGDYVLLGNPYPSAISINDFLTHNPGTQETFYIWNSGAEMIDNAYGGGNYNTYAPNTGSVPAGSINGYIPVGQGFFIKRGAAIAPFVFTNAMRQTTQDGVFSKAATADKFWLELNAPSGSKPQMLIGFNAAATAGYDAGFDAALFGTNADALYSEVNGTKLVIDAHGTFSSDDTFALKADLSAAGNYTIGILKSEGVFASGQQIWLKDQLTGTTTLISEQPYAFSADAGTLANRFVLQFKPGGALATDGAVKAGITIFSSGSEIHARAAEHISSVEVYEMSGKLIANARTSQKDVTVQVNYQGVVLVKIALQNGTVQTEKLMLK